MTEGDLARESTSRSLFRARWRALALLAGTSVVGGLLEAAFLVTITRAGVAIANGETKFTATRSIDLSINEALVFATCLIVLRVGVAVLGAWQRARLSASLTGAIRSRLASAFLLASWEAQQSTRTGRLQELLTTFAQQGTVLVAAISQSISSGFNLAALLLTAVLVEPVVALVVVAATALLGLALLPLRRAVRRQASTTSGAGMSFATSVAEHASLGLETHVFGVQVPTQDRVQGLIKQHITTQRRLRFLQGLVPAIYTGLAYLAIVGALAVVARLDASDLGSTGAVMLIMLRSLSYGQALQTSAASATATRPFLASLDEETKRYEAAPRAGGDVRIESVGTLRLAHVSFSYPNAPELVLRDIDLEIGPVEVVGVVGPSGSGKSTLVQLLLGLRRPTTGTVSVDGVGLGEVDRGPWTRLTTFVPQHAHFITGTVADNIRFLREHVSQQQIEAAAKLAHLHDDIVAWPGGYERDVGDQGGNLSGGQQQRLIIARALVEDPDVLILDEPTSALDVRSESLIRRTLSELRKSTTIVIIAHRLSTLDICDRIMVIQDGELKAFDTPERLAETSDFYREALELSGLR